MGIPQSLPSSHRQGLGMTNKEKRLLAQDISAELTERQMKFHSNWILRFGGVLWVLVILAVLVGVVLVGASL